MDFAVSVVIPVYNRAQLVHRAIQSVLDQTFQDFELIVVDDGSTDHLEKSLAPIKDARLRLIRHDRNKGAAAARNTGMVNAGGDYIAWLDSDDYWLADKLARQVAFMRDDKTNARISCTAYEIVSHYHPDGEIRRSQHEIKLKDMQAGCRLSPGSTLMTERSLYQEIGPLNEDMRRLEDWDWLLRVLKVTDLAVLDEVLTVVDYYAVEEVSYDAVKSSVGLMRDAHFTASRFLPSITRLRFLSTLENELAAAAYRNSQFGPAHWHLLKSVCYYPYRKIDYFRRVARAIVADVFGVAANRRRTKIH